MKQKDVMLIVVVIIISSVVSIILCNKIISSPKNRSQKAEVVEAISSDFPNPSAKYFNSKSIDSTQTVKISNNDNKQPFNGSQ
jgi:hypothetical protein